MDPVVSERLIAAPPPSVALLVSGPGAADLVPGVVGVDHPELGVLVLDTRLPDEVTGAQAAGPGTARLTLRVSAPRRTPTSFVLRFRLGGFERPLSGLLTLAWASDAHGGPATRARLRIEPEGRPAGRDASGVAPAAAVDSEAAVVVLADGFLRGLSDRASGRADAA